MTGKLHPVSSLGAVLQPASRPARSVSKMSRTLALEVRIAETRDMARRAMRLANSMLNADDRARLMKYAEELDAEADHLEQQEHPARPVIAPRPQPDGAANHPYRRFG